MYVFLLYNIDPLDSIEIHDKSTAFSTTGPLIALRTGSLYLSLTVLCGVPLLKVAGFKKHHKLHIHERKHIGDRIVPNKGPISII